MNRVERELSVGPWRVDVESWRPALKRVTWRRELHGHPHIYRDIIPTECATTAYIQAMRPKADLSAEQRLISSKPMELVDSDTGSG